MRNWSSHQRVSVDSEQLDRKLENLSDVIRVQADFGVGFVTIMDASMVNSSAGVEVDDSGRNRQHEPKDVMTSFKSVEGSQGSGENLNINPSESPTHKRHSPDNNKRGLEELIDDEQKAGYSKSGIMLMGSVPKASIGDSSPEKVVGAVDQVLTRGDETVSVISENSSSTAVLVEEINDQFVDTQNGLVSDAESKLSDLFSSHEEIQDSKTFDDVKKPTKNISPIPELGSDNNGEPKTCSAERADSADGFEKSFQPEQDQKTKSETPTESLMPEFVQPSSEYQSSPTTLNGHSAIEEDNTFTAQNPSTGEDQVNQIMEERSLQGEKTNSALYRLRSDAIAAIPSNKMHTPSASNIDVNPKYQPQVKSTPDSNHTPSLAVPHSTDALVDHVKEERCLRDGKTNTNILAEISAEDVIPSDQRLAPTASNIDMSSSNGSLVKSKYTPSLIDASTGPHELSHSEQSQSSEEVTPKTPEENRTALPQPLPSSEFQLEFFRAGDETSTPKDEGATAGTTATTNLLKNHNNKPLEYEINHIGGPKQQTAGSDREQLPMGKHVESPPNQSDALNKAGPRQLDSLQSTKRAKIILSDDEHGNRRDETRDVQTHSKAILPLEGRAKLPEPPKMTLPLKEAAARLACTRTVNEQQLITNRGNETSQDVRAGIHIRTILEKRATDTITFPELRKAILQGMPAPPRIYKIQVEPNSNPKKHDQGINDGVAKKMTWITGSYHLQRFFCWPCLLFSTEVWEIPVKLGFDDIVEAAKIHQITTAHMSANIKLLVQETALKREQKAKLEADRESRIQFELLLKRLIDITCSFDSTRAIDEYLELMESACFNDIDVQDFLVKKAAVFRATGFLTHFVESYVPAILEAMERLLHSKIVDEIGTAQFVTVIFEEMTNVVDKSSVAVIIRYVSEFGVPRERFVKMIKLGSSRTVADLLQTMNQLVQEYQLREKLVGFTYSGTVISAREVLIFNKTVNRLYQKARFIPYQEHNFKRIIKQSLSHSPACRHFFYTINELAEFLEKTPNVMETLYTVGMPMFAQNKREFVDDFVTILKNYYKTIMEFFDLIKKDDSEWDPAIVMQVEYFSHFLNSPNCQVLVMVVSATLEAANDLCTALQDSVNIELWKRLLSETRNKLSEMKKAGLGKMLLENEPLAVATEYAKLFDQIIETAILTVNHRLADVEMAFAGQQFIEAASQCNGDALIAYQQRVGMNPENFLQLQIEAKSFFGDSPSAINIEHSIKSICDSNVNHAKQHLLKFLQLSQTIPTKESYTSDSKPAIHTLRSYITTMKSQKSLDLLILTGKDILNRMRQEEEFYDIILELCLRKTRQNSD